MKLFYAAPSPYARKAHATAIETGMADKIEMERTSPWTDPEGYRDINPVGKVPALVRDDGAPLYQSNVICEYFDDQGDTKVFPAAGPARWTALRQLAAADGILDASVHSRMEGMFHEGEAISQKFLDRQEVSVVAALDQLGHLLLDGGLQLLWLLHRVLGRRDHVAGLLRRLVHNLHRPLARHLLVRPHQQRGCAGGFPHRTPNPGARLPAQS